VIPRSDGVTLGGCRHYESYDVSLSHHDSAAIKERCFKLIPSLQKARVLRECAGLRPHRSIVRVEPESLGKLKVRHLERPLYLFHWQVGAHETDSHTVLD
jgi:D-aspartate oxidase